MKNDDKKVTDNAIDKSKTDGDIEVIIFYKRYALHIRFSMLKI